MIAKFTSFKGREQVFNERKKLRGTAVYVDEDFPVAVRERRRVLRTFAFPIAKAQGVPMRLVYPFQEVRVANRTYRVEDVVSRSERTALPTVGGGGQELQCGGQVTQVEDHLRDEKSVSMSEAGGAPKRKRACDGEGEGEGEEEVEVCDVRRVEGGKEQEKGLQDAQATNGRGGTSGGRGRSMAKWKRGAPKGRSNSISSYFESVTACRSPFRTSGKTARSPVGGDKRKGGEASPPGRPEPEKLPVEEREAGMDVENGDMDKN